MSTKINKNENLENCEKSIVKAYIYGPGIDLTHRENDVVLTHYNYTLDKRCLKRDIEEVECCILGPEDYMFYYDIYAVDEEPTSERNKISFCSKLGVVAMYIDTKDMFYNESIILKDKVTGINYFMKSNKTYELISDYTKENEGSVKCGNGKL